jgi:DNA-directed RNA polymerase specialized sigma24 family protein
MGAAAPTSPRRAVFVLREAFGLSYDQIGAAIGTLAGKVRRLDKTSELAR